jgi:hypothetical protein
LSSGRGGWGAIKYGTEVHAAPIRQRSINVIAGEAKQSSFCRNKGKLDCFVASAPLRKRFAFVAGNDAVSFSDSIVKQREDVPPQSRGALRPKDGSEFMCCLHLA